MDTHYLKLVYLAETAIVFNLAYIELEWKRQFHDLCNKMGSNVAMASVTNERKSTDSVCTIKPCEKCDHNDHLSDKFDRYEFKYISEIAGIVHSVQYIAIRDFFSKKKPIRQARFKLLSRAWEHSEVKYTKKLLAVIHLIAQTYLDRIICFIALGAASACMLLMTMLDAGIDIFGLFTLMGFQSHSELWESAIFWVLLIVLFLPSIFWASWRLFLFEYECLSFLLAEAYQYKVGKFDVNKI